MQMFRRLGAKPPPANSAYAPLGKLIHEKQEKKTINGNSTYSQHIANVNTLPL